jgi:hypothetical protein
MTRGLLYPALLFATRLVAVQIPPGSELSIRLLDKVASEAQNQPAGQSKVIHAVLIAPVILNGSIAVSAGAQLSGSVKHAKAATDKEPAQLQLVFTELNDGASHAVITAVVTSLDNARETIDDKGMITGIAPGETYSARIDQGIAKLEANDKFAGSDRGNQADPEDSGRKSRHRLRFGGRVYAPPDATV